MFRNYDIKHNGKADINGIFRAKTESFLKNIETFGDCMLFGYVVKHLFDSRDKLDDYPYFTYWLIIDIIIMVCTLAYSYMT